MNENAPTELATLTRRVGAQGARDLLALARDTVHARVLGRDENALLFERCPSQPLYGAFVTLKAEGRLRGCIGSVGSIAPARELIRRSAAASALSDPRFPAVSPDEIDLLAYEISLLTPLVEMASKTLPDAVRVGEDGLVVVSGARRGLLLPQVAVEWGWDAPTFLDQTCQKAALPAGAWRDKAQVFRFAAWVINA